MLKRKIPTSTVFPPHLRAITAGGEKPSYSEKFHYPTEQKKFRLVFQFSSNHHRIPSLHPTSPSVQSVRSTIHKKPETLIPKQQWKLPQGWNIYNKNYVKGAWVSTRFSYYIMFLQSYFASRHGISEREKMCTVDILCIHFFLAGRKVEIIRIFSVFLRALLQYLSVSTVCAKACCSLFNKSHTTMLIGTEYNIFFLEMK